MTIKETIEEKEIKRYKPLIRIIEGHYGIDRIIEAEEGMYVKYTDHKAVVETMQKRIEELEAENKSLYLFNKSLRCCANCNNYNNSSDGYICDIGSIEDCSNDDCCDNWTIKIAKFDN